jgi:hypothetical protein
MFTHPSERPRAASAKNASSYRLGWVFSSFAIFDMAGRISSVAQSLFALSILCVVAGTAQAQHNSEKQRHVPRTIWNFDGGIFVETDGSLTEKTCFRLAGKVEGDHFFDNLKRVDDDSGTRYVRGKENITDFPEQLNLLFVIHDWPCPSQIRGNVGGREYLTRDMMSKTKLSLFWKRGVELRPVNDFKVSFFSVKPVEPYAKELAKELPERLQWAYELEVPSAGVPVSDSLVLVMRRADGSVAARVAARM